MKTIMVEENEIPICITYKSTQSVFLVIANKYYNPVVFPFFLYLCIKSFNYGKEKNYKKGFKGNC